MAVEPIDYSLYLVTDSEQAGGWENVAGIVEKAIVGGVSIVQVRDKHADDETFSRLVESVIQVAEPHRVPAIVNDRLEVAAHFGLDAHVGQDDAPLHQAREILGTAARIGLSVGSDAELDAVLSLDHRPDLIGLGPVFATSTKLDAGAPLGVAGLLSLAQRARQNGLVSVAIGGINEENIATVRTTPVDGVCVVSAIMASPDPYKAALRLSGTK